jgi:acetyltransferase-like isoleucine patch superfamily enzyme
MQLYNWYLRAMGTKVGKDVFCLGGVVAEYEQVTIGDGAVIADGAFLLTHTVEARHVKIRPIRIGKQCTIGALSAVLPDACMEDYSTLAEMSLVSKSYGCFPCCYVTTAGCYTAVIGICSLSAMM